MKWRLISSVLTLILAAAVFAYPARNTSADDSATSPVLSTPVLSPGDPAFLLVVPSSDAENLPVDADPRVAAYIFAVKIVGPAGGGSGNQVVEWGCHAKVDAKGTMGNTLWSWVVYAEVYDHGGWIETKSVGGSQHVNHPYWSYSHDIFTQSPGGQKSIEVRGRGHFEGHCPGCGGRKYAQIDLTLITGHECSAQSFFGDW